MCHKKSKESARGVWGFNFLKIELSWSTIILFINLYMIYYLAKKTQVGNLDLLASPFGQGLSVYCGVTIQAESLESTQEANE